MKTYKIREAVRWLLKYAAKRQGLVSYVSPMLYTESRCKEIIWHSTDEEIRSAGFDVEEARRLARPPALFDYLMEQGAFSCVPR